MFKLSVDVNPRSLLTSAAPAIGRAIVAGCAPGGGESDASPPARDAARASITAVFHAGTVPGATVGLLNDCVGLPTHIKN